MTPAEAIPKALTDNGDTRVDNYYWLREKNNPKVIAYLEAENEYTERMLRHTVGFQQHLYRELLGRIKETDQSAPYKRDDYHYYFRTEQGKQYRKHCRKKGSLDAAEEILLDENELAEGHAHFALGVLRPSPDHQILAYSTDTTGAEVFTLAFKDLKTGQPLGDEIAGTYYDVVWGEDNRTVFYTTLDRAKRPYKVFRHALGTDPKKDVLVYHEKDERFWVRLGKTLSRAYVLINVDSKITSEIRFLPADQPTGAWQVLQPRRQGIEYSVSHHGDTFFIVTNDGAKNFRLVTAPVDNPGTESWKELIAHREAVKIDSAEVFRHHLVVFEREAGLQRIRIRHLASGEEHYVQFPEPIYGFWPGPNEELDTAVLRFTYTSLVTPKSVVDYDMSTRRWEVKKEDEVLGGYDKTSYRTERIFATARDGTRVPISLVYRRDLPRDGTSPLFLYGYGSYGASVDPHFSPHRISLLDRGLYFAIAHVRGGGTLGRAWYEDGKMLKKKNTFTDFIACAEHLIAEGYTSADRLVIYGASAGGLLMGAVTNMRPDLFAAVVAKVPFVDVLTTMLDESIPLTVIEYEEWGNPHEKKTYDVIKNYSPYDNVKPKAYPRMLVTAGLNDPRVQYWEPAKWVAKLRALKTDDNLLLLKTKMGSGHMGASGRYDHLREMAFEYAFVFDSLGIHR